MGDEDDRYRIVACDRVDVLHRVLDHQVVPLRVSGYLEVVQVVDDDELASFRNEVLYQRSYVVDLHALLRVRLDVQDVTEPVGKVGFRGSDVAVERVTVVYCVRHEFAFREVLLSSRPSYRSNFVVQILLAPVLVPVFQNEASYFYPLP